MANPKKSKPVQDILLKNREKLLAFLPKFHDDRRGKTDSIYSMTKPSLISLFLGLEDEQFIDEKGFLMKQIIELGNQPQQPQGAVFA